MFTVISGVGCFALFAVASCPACPSYLPHPGALAFAAGKTVFGRGRNGNIRIQRYALAVEDPFDVLGLDREASDVADVRAAFRKLAKIYHPDVRGTGDPTIFKAVLQAAQELSTSAGRMRWYTRVNSRRHPPQSMHGFATASRAPRGTAGRGRRSGGGVHIKHDVSWSEQPAGFRELEAPPLPPTAPTSPRRDRVLHLAISGVVAWISFALELAAVRTSLRLKGIAARFRRLPK